MFAGYPTSSNANNTSEDFHKYKLILVLLNPDPMCPVFVNSADPDQLASEEAK